MRNTFIVAAIACLAIFSFGNAFAGPTEERVTVLEVKVATLEATVASQQTAIDSLQSAVAALQSRAAALESSPAVQIGSLGYMRLDTSELNGVIGPHVIFEGVNLHLQNGAGASQNSGEDAPNGLGNLIVGYDDVDTNANGQLNPGDRSGSHNLVIGWGNKFPSVSGLVHGYRNTARGWFPATISGWRNDVTSYSAIVSGNENISENDDSSIIIGGSRNKIEYMGNHNKVLIGGQNNIMPEWSQYSVLIGGTSMLLP